MVRKLWTVLSLAAVMGSACGGEEPATGGVSSSWVHEAPAPAAPAGVGPEGRAVVVIREAQGAMGGRLVTLDQRNGLAIEGPFDGQPISDHAPIMADNRVFVLNKVGGLAGVSLAGEPLFTTPPAAPSATSPLAIGADRILRWGTAAGDLVGASLDGAVVFRASIGDPLVTALGIGPDLRTYGTTDTGRVVGVDGAGAIVFDVRVDAPAEGVSVSAAGEVAVGEASGLRVFTSGGAEKWRHARGARVVGTTWVGDRLLAWGEDGVLERLDPSGSVEMTFRTATSNPPPIYGVVLPLSTGAVGLVDATGTAHLVGPDGTTIGSTALGGEPLRERVLGDDGRMLVVIGKQVHGLLFTHTVAE